MAVQSRRRKKALRPYQQVLFQGRLPVVDYRAVMQLARQEQQHTMRKVTAAEIVRRAVREYVNRRADRGPARSADGAAEQGLEQQWLREHGPEFAGQWVALDGSRLLSHGRDARAVYESARASGVALPLVVRVGKRDEPPFAGW